jgi:hypothetical protein
MNLPKELHLTGQQPNIALAIFFIPYILFEVRIPRLISAYFITQRSYSEQYALEHTLSKRIHSL